MSALKTEVMNLLQGLPDSATLDDMLAEIYFKAQVDIGLKELDEGRGIPHDEVEKRMEKWLVSKRSVRGIIGYKNCKNESV